MGRGACWVCLLTPLGIRVTLAEDGGTHHASNTPGFEPCCRGRHLRSIHGAGTVMPERRIGCELCALGCEHAQGQRNRDASLWPSPHLHPRNRQLEANPQVPLALTDHYAPHTFPPSMDYAVQA